MFLLFMQKSINSADLQLKKKRKIILYDSETTLAMRCSIIVFKQKKFRLQVDELGKQT